MRANRYQRRSQEANERDPFPILCLFCVFIFISSSSTQHQPSPLRIARSLPKKKKKAHDKTTTTRLLSNTDNAASGTAASVASLLALLVAALAEVVGAGVHDDGAAEDALGADQLDVLVGHGALGVALGVGLEVAQVADVALAVAGGAVGLVVRVDWWVGLVLGDVMEWCVGEPWGNLTVRTGAGAAVGVVTEGVDVHATLGVGVVAADVPGDLGLGGLGGLVEGDGALDVGVTTDNSDWKGQ